MRFAELSSNVILNTHQTRRNTCVVFYEDVIILGVPTPINSYIVKHFNREYIVTNQSLSKPPWNTLDVKGFPSES